MHTRPELHNYNVSMYRNARRKRREHDKFICLPVAFLQASSVKWNKICVCLVFKHPKDRFREREKKIRI